MELELLGATLRTTGEVLIAFSVLRVHQRMLNEHRLDGAVMRVIRKEQLLGIFGMFFIVAGFLLETGIVA